MSSRPRVSRRRIIERVDAAIERSRAVTDLPAEPGALRSSPQPEPRHPVAAPETAGVPTSGLAPRGGITAETPVRGIGDLPREVWSEVLETAGSPLLPELDAILLAVSPHGALGLAAAYKESSLGKAANARATNNPLGLMVRGSSPSQLQRFPSWAVAFAEFRDRLSAVGPPYEPVDISIQDYTAVYVGGPLCRSTRGATCANGETWRPGGDRNAGSINLYIDQTVSRLNAWGAGATAEPGEPSAPLNFGPHPLPAGFETRIATKKRSASGWGWDFTTQRRGPNMGIVFWHHTAGGVGFGKDECLALFSEGGEREYQALTEAVIDRDGSGYVMNDPWSADLMDGSGRIPWASGPSNNVGSILLPFIQRYGANAINRMGWATEHCHAAGEAWGDRLLDGSARLHGWVITKMRIPWHDWPRNPSLGGLWSSYDHDDAAATSCPGMPRQVRDALVAATALVAKKLQTGGLTAPTPEPTPPTPTPRPAWAYDFTVEQVAGFWDAAGGLERFGPDGAVQVYGFDPEGPISAMWLARARQSGVFPAALEWYERGEGGQIVTFGSAGDVDWVLALPDVMSRADWRWLDVRPA